MHSRWLPTICDIETYTLGIRVHHVPGIHPTIQTTASHLADLSIPKRLKQAVDSRIAEEQARQKTPVSPVTRSNSTAQRSLSRTESPASRPRKPRPKDNDGTPVRGPDPSEFETAFVIEDESEEPSGVNTPTMTDEKTTESAAPSEAGTSLDGSERSSEKTTVTPPKAIELPQEVRTKLRKLEKLESKYQGIALYFGDF